MRYGSVCSGIEAATAAWHPLGWEPAFFSEIDKFPRTVLEHHYPDVPLHGDMTKFKEWPDYDIDLLVGGTPCQSFSIAGLREGMADPRGNLTLTFLAIADHYKPQYIVWENVPGVLSSNGGKDFESFLDGLEKLGYIIDVDILDAQFFGVPQRRRRVFVCGQHRDDLLSQRTDTSALTIAQCLAEILHAILVDQSPALGNAPANSESASLSRDGILRRMRLFGIHGEDENWPTLRENLVAALQRFRTGQNNSVCHRGDNEKELTLDALLMGLVEEDLSTLTDELLRKSLDESYEVMKSYTTSTAINSITPQGIYMCSAAALNIARLTVVLSPSSPTWWSAASSSLTLLREYIGFARHTSSDLFGDLERVQAWTDFIREAEPAETALRGARVRPYSGKILPLPDSLSGHPPPRREARKGTAPPVAKSLRDNSGGIDREDMHTLVLSSGQANAELTVDVAPALNCNRDGAPIAFQSNGNTDDLMAAGVNVSPTMQGGGQGGNPPAVAFAQNSRDELRLEGGDGQVSGALSTGGGKPGQGSPMVAYSIMPMNSGKDYKARETEVAQPLMAGGLVGGNQGGDYAAQSMAVRRLTPTECERLQGFPDGYTAIPWRGKTVDNCPDGPRYKALGNSMAVPVMRWIGERIDTVNELKAQAKAVEIVAGLNCNTTGSAE